MRIPVGHWSRWAFGALARTRVDGALWLRRVVATTGLVTLAACGLSDEPNVPLENFTAKEIFDRGEFELGRDRADDAAFYFGEVERLYPYRDRKSVV